LGRTILVVGRYHSCYIIPDVIKAVKFEVSWKGSWEEDGEGKVIVTSLDSQVKLREVDLHAVSISRIYVSFSVFSTFLGPEALFFTLDGDVEVAVWPIVETIDVHCALHGLTGIVHPFGESHENLDILIFV